MLAYVARVNLSATISRVAEALNTTPETLGIAGSTFFVIYAAGQLVNGFRNDRKKPRRVIMTALIGITAINTLLLFSQDVLWFTVLWGLNGYFQSLLWGPLIRVLHGKYSRRMQGILSTGMSTSIIVGFILGWLFLGCVMYQASWKYSFAIPAVLTGITCAGWYWWGQEADGTAEQMLQPEKGLGWIRYVWQTLRQERLLWCLAACFCMGLVREGIAFWMPLLLSQTMGINIRYSAIYIVCIPLANIVGVTLANILANRFPRGVESTLCFLFGLLGVSALLLFLNYQASPLLLVVLFSCISAMAYGIHSLLLGVIPLQCGRFQITASVVGLNDFFCYLGASLSVFVFGKFIAQADWQWMALIWSGAALCGGFASLRALHKKRQHDRTERMKQTA